MKNILKYSILVFLCVSCEFFNGSVVKEETIVAREKENIDLETVDQFPSFAICDHLAKEELKACFFEAVSNHIYDRLETSDLLVTRTIHDTIYVDLQVDKEGVIVAEAFHKSDIVSKELPQLDSLITESIKSLPKASPANKRGIPVATKFKLPIIINVTE